VKILFVHGFASSGAYKTAASLRTLLAPCEVIAPDVPIDPYEAYWMLKGICEVEKPDLVIGLSLGGFWAQKLRGFRKILINPEFDIAGYLGQYEGQFVDYLSPRKDGANSLFVSSRTREGFRYFQKTQFDGLDNKEIELTQGMFATGDELVHCKGIFDAHYPGRSISYQGAHLPTFPELKKNLIPLV